MGEFFPINEQPDLFSIDGQLSEEDALFLEETRGISSVRGASGEIVSRFRAKSYFSIGDPIVLSLTRLITECGHALPADIRLQMPDYEFYQIQLACSFQAAPGCRFHDARFALTLQTVPDDPALPTQTALSRAIAYDLFPLRLEDGRKVTIKRSLNPEIKFNFDSVSSSLTLPLCDRAEDYIIYTSYIEAFDMQGTQPAWQFMRTKSHEIGGPQKLFMILRKPKGTYVKARFSLSASVQFMIGNIALNPLPLVMRRNPQSVITDMPMVSLC